jgi:hypothetical protein
VLDLKQACLNKNFKRVCASITELHVLCLLALVFGVKTRSGELMAQEKATFGVRMKSDKKVDKN